MTDDATFRCYTSGTLEDARAKATRHFAAFFGAFEVLSTDVEVVMLAHEAEVVGWAVTVRARAL